MGTHPERTLELGPCLGLASSCEAPSLWLRVKLQVMNPPLRPPTASPCLPGT